MKPTDINKDDARRLAQMTIDLDSLEKYFHPDLPGRKPLCVATTAVITEDLGLTKFGLPVRFLTGAAAKKAGTPHFEFSKLEVHGDDAIVEFAYPVEGIRGTAKFRRAGGIWRVEERQVHEK